MKLFYIVKKNAVRQTTYTKAVNNCKCALNDNRPVVDTETDAMGISQLMESAQ